MPAALTDADEARLVDAARQARERAYTPYSGYRVGAALLTRSGAIFTGCNVENAAYPATICAERVALTKAVSEGAGDFAAIAVVTRNGAAPCGVCRQVMAELGPEMLVILADEERVVVRSSVPDLLPLSFGPAQLR